MTTSHVASVFQTLEDAQMLPSKTEQQTSDAFEVLGDIFALVAHPSWGSIATMSEKYEHGPRPEISL